MTADGSPLGGSSSVRTQIPDFTAAKRRKNYGRMIVGKIMAWGIFNHGDHGEHRGKLRARVHSRREWGRTKTLQAGLPDFRFFICQSQLAGIIRAHPCHPWFIFSL
jgi:hypothetical protein